MFLYVIHSKITMYFPVISEHLINIKVELHDEILSQIISKFFTIHLELNMNSCFIASYPACVETFHSKEVDWFFMKYWDNCDHKSYFTLLHRHYIRIIYTTPSFLFGIALLSHGFVMDLCPKHNLKKNFHKMSISFQPIWASDCSVFFPIRPIFRNIAAFWDLQCSQDTEIKGVQYHNWQNNWPQKYTKSNEEFFP